MFPTSQSSATEFVQVKGLVEIDCGAKISNQAWRYLTAFDGEIVNLSVPDDRSAEGGVVDFELDDLACIVK